MLLNKFLSSSFNRIKTIEQKFFISGHSYNSCVRCLGLIEKQKNITSEIFVPDHWVNLISQSKINDPKFEVHQMTSADFYSSEVLENLIVNRKKTSTKQKINWLRVRHVINKKDQIFDLILGEDLHDDAPELIVSLDRKNVTAHMFAKAKLEKLFEGGREIIKSKYADLIELLKYIPTKYHIFFNELRQTINDDNFDYGLASESEEE